MDDRPVILDKGFSFPKKILKVASWPIIKFLQRWFSFGSRSDHFGFSVKTIVESRLMSDLRLGLKHAGG